MTSSTSRRRSPAASSSLPCRRGGEVKAGDLLFKIDDTEATAAVAQADAELARAEAQLANLKQGQRPPEIAVLEAQIAEAEAALDKARRDFERQKALFDSKVASEAQLDQAREAITVAEARVTAARRQRDVAAMPARTPEIDAGERAVDASRAALDQARTRVTKYVVDAPVAGRIEDTYYEAGEVATVGAAVLELLPADKRKVIFFVPEAARPALMIGSNVVGRLRRLPGGSHRGADLPRRRRRNTRRPSSSAARTAAS